jgi:hypothetical protein
MNIFFKFSKQILTTIIALCYLSIIVTLFLWYGSNLIFLSIFTFGIPLIIAGAILYIPLRGVKLCYSKTKDELIMKYMFSNSTVLLFLLFILSSQPLSRYAGPNNEYIPPLLTTSIIVSMVAYLFFSAIAFIVTKDRLNK